MRIKIKDKVYDIEISEVEGKVKIIVNGKEFLFGKEEKEISIPHVSLPKRDFSKKEIMAPIAGRISELFVKEEEFVKKDQKLLLLSSMKMENEIIADFEGKVKEILIKKDQEVRAGQRLITLI